MPETRMPFGKFKNKLLSEIHPAYLNWVLCTLPVQIWDGGPPTSPPPRPALDRTDARCLECLDESARNGSVDRGSGAAIRLPSMSITWSFHPAGRIRSAA
jgi:hypothetical protein